MKNRCSLILSLIILTGLLSCENDKNSADLKEMISCSIPDGSYTAHVFYENLFTNYSSTYTLDVDVMNNQLIVLYFPNLEYLDENDFSSQYQDSNCLIHMIDKKGRNFTIQVLR